MKKLLIVLMISLTFVSCGYAPMDNTMEKPIVITSIENVGGNSCNYYGRGNYNMVVTLTSSEFKFRDTCGKFQIGDTINFVKK